MAQIGFIPDLAMQREITKGWIKNFVPEVVFGQAWTTVISVYEVVKVPELMTSASSLHTFFEKHKEVQVPKSDFICFLLLLQ